MSINLVNRKRVGKTVVYTILTFVLLSAVILSMIGYLYTDAENQAFENLHIQTKQVKDDLTLQILSDRENLSTMANFAAKLYLDGEDYSLLFNSFKPIGLIENIGILDPHNVFSTKTGSLDLDGLISFGEEAERGAYISGRVKDLTKDDNELVRSAVPINANGEIVGILYGVIKLDKIEERYLGVAQELEAQIFVCDAETGDLILDSVHDELGNISFLKDREYHGDYSFEDIVNTDKGFSSFKSAYRNEDVLLHYSTIEDLGWKILLVRYDSQVFAYTHELSRVLLLVFFAMAVIMGAFVLLLMMAERHKSAINDCASDIRKTLIEASGMNNYIDDALKEGCIFTKSSSVSFFDTNGEEYHYISPNHSETKFSDAEKKSFMAELFRYVSEIQTKNGDAIKVGCIEVNKRLSKTNESFYALLKKSKISQIIFSATVNNSNHITILAIINSKRKAEAKLLAEKVSACFSIALNNKTTLNRTRLAATTDSLTGALNRVAYKSDLVEFDEEKPLNFSCVYVDVNELHLRNNKYGHAAGDEMLLYIAHTLKDVFFGQKVYRMGGDEFLVFCQNSEQEDVNKGIDIFLDQLKLKDYHVAIGMSYRSQNTNTEEMVREAEVRMYEAKAKYYQTKEEKNLSVSAEREYVQTKTGILEIDTMLSVLKENYNGIYRVSLDTDKARRILMPAYLNYNETEEDFSKLFSKYVSESVESDYHRALLSFRNYDALKQQLAEGKIPRITYKKLSGESVTLSVYRLCDSDNASFDTLWIFAKK